MRLSGHRGVLAAVIAALVLTTCIDSAEARKRIRQRPSKGGEVARTTSDDDMGGSKYAAYVVDNNTGKVLFERNGDAPRHPASLTKMLTLYILFEELERGRVKLDTDFTVSAKASAEAPSKLGLRPGSTISAEDALKSLVTLSANDAAMVIAENLAGSESAFAERMNRTARRIGMTGSTFYNPNGLPDMRQITTAHDMVVLGAALQERFPTYYRYFQTRSFAFRGRFIGNHNRLLGRVEGVDGIKTGYTQASGFNLVSSVRRDGRHIVAAVMGGPTGAARDRHMTRLLETYLPVASGGGKKATIVADASRGAPADDAPRKTAIIAPIKISADDTAQKPSVEKGAAVAMARAVLLPDAAPQKPAIEAPMVIVPQKPATLAAMIPPPPPADAKKTTIVFSQGAEGLPPKTTQRVPAAPLQVADEPRVTSLADAKISMKDVADLVETASVKPRVANVKTAADDAPQPGLARIPANAVAQSGWLIQIGATDREADAKALLSKAQGQVASVLKGASGYTESVGKGSGTLYRARFAGFSDQTKANAACAALKRKDFSCLAMKR